MRRQYLDPRTERSADEIVSRLCGVQAQVDVDGRRALMLTDHVEDLADGAEAESARLLGGFDQYVA